MGFSDSAIGFYLQMEDQMTPQFPAAINAYGKFVASMEKLNRRAFEGSSGMFAQLGQLVKGVTHVAGGAAMKVNLQLTKRAQAGFQKLVSDAVSHAFAGAKIRLRATMPDRVLKMFAHETGLRSLYSKLPQPPDMTGGIQRFAEGGKVKGGTPGKDSVLGLLTPGEVVVPTDLVAKLEEAFDTVGGRKKVLEAGLGDKNDMVFYQKALVEIADAMGMLADQTKNAGIEAKTRLTPQIVELRERFDQLAKSEDRAVEGADTLLGRALGPARFAALSLAVRGVQDGFGQLQGGIQGFAGEVGAGEFQSFPDRLREIRQRLGLGAEEAVKFTGAIAEGSKTIGTNFFKSLEATDALIGAGIKDRSILIAQSPLLARANRVTGAEFDDLAKSIFYYTRELKGSTEGFDSIILSINNLTKASDLAVNTPALMETLGAAVNNPSIKKEGPAAIQTYINNLLELRATAETVFEGQSGIAQIFQDAIAGKDVTENFKKIGILTSGTIQNMDDLQRALTSKDGLTGAFDELAKQLQGADPIGIERLAAETGVEGSFLKRLQDFTETQRKTRGLTVPLEDSAGAGDKLTASMSSMTTSAEKLNNAVANTVGSSGPMQKLIEILDQVPVLGVLAAVHLGGTLVRSIGTLGRAVMGFFGIFGKAGGVVGKLAGGIGGGGGAGGMLGGLGGISARGLLVFGAKLGLILGAVTAVLLTIGYYADDIMPVLEQSLPGLVKLGQFVVKEASIGIADTITSVVNIFKPIVGMRDQFAATAGAMMDVAKFLGAVGLVGAELAVLGTAAVIGDAVGQLLSYFGVKSPMQALRDQSEVMVDTLLFLSFDLMRLEPIGMRIPKIEPALAGSAKFMTALKPLIDQTIALGDSAKGLDDGLFTTGPLSALRSQAEPMVDTITELSIWFTRVPVNQKAIEGVDFARVFFSKLALAVGSMQQIGAVNPEAIIRTVKAMQQVDMSQPSARPTVSKAEIDQIMQVVVQAGDASPVHKDLQITNELLTELIAAVKNGGVAAMPSRVTAPTSRNLDSNLRAISEFQQ